MELPMRALGAPTNRELHETNVRLETIIKEIQRTNELLAGIVTELRVRDSSLGRHSIEDADH